MARFLVKVNKRQFYVIVNADDVKAINTIAGINADCGKIAKRAIVLLHCAYQQKSVKAAALSRATKLLEELESLACDIWAEWVNYYGTTPSEQSFILDIVEDCRDFARDYL